MMCCTDNGTTKPKGYRDAALRNSPAWGLHRCGLIFRRPRHGPRVSATATVPDQVRWIRSYVTSEADGRLGTICIYEATSPEAIREHARCAELPVDEIISIADTVVVRPDPEPAAA